MGWERVEGSWVGRGGVGVVGGLRSVVGWPRRAERWKAVRARVPGPCSARAPGPRPILPSALRRLGDHRPSLADDKHSPTTHAARQLLFAKIQLRPSRTPPLQAWDGTRRDCPWVGSGPPRVYARQSQALPRVSQARPRARAPPGCTGTTDPNRDARGGRISPTCCPLPARHNPTRAQPCPQHAYHPSLPPARTHLVNLALAPRTSKSASHEPQRPDPR